MKRGLVIFAKEPLPGLVKTRLAAGIGADAAAGFYQEMLGNVIDLSRKLTGVETLVYWDCPEQALPRLADRFACRSRRQCDGNLGQRMESAFTEMFADGHDICCIIGSDAPDLPLAYLHEAYQRLEENQPDAVFGPCTDGGYYLLGLRRVWPQLFANIHWSSPLVLQQSLAAASKSGLTTALLPEWRDIDTREDLLAFHERNSLKKASEQR